MPSCNTYRFTWVSLTLGVGYLFTAVPAKRSHCSLPWTRGIRTATLPDLQCGIAPLGPSTPMQPQSTVQSINYLMLSFLYGPTLTSIHDYWKNRSFDYMDFVGKIVSLLFNMLSKYCHGFSSKEQVSFNS